MRKCVLFLFIAIVHLEGPAGAASPLAGGLTLSGRVVETTGKPIRGAQVLVYTAQPRVGIGAACPSCYPECAKSATTDAKGRFAIAGLGDHLLYRLLFVAEGHVPQFLPHVDPLAGAVAETLQVRDERPVPGLRTTIGYVFDSGGSPVAGASVFAEGMRVGNSTMFGSLENFNAHIEPMVITGKDGQFRLTGPDSVQAWVLKVYARGLSPRAFADVESQEPSRLILSPGATVIGSVLKGGVPAAGVPLGLNQLDRRAQAYVRLDTVATDEHGRFTFVNVPANQDYALGSLPGSTGTWALRTVVRTVGEDDSVTDVPTLSLEPGFELAGRVTLSDGKPLPGGTELSMWRELMSGSTVVRMDEDGRFVLHGLPPETINLGIRMRGYHLAPSTPGYAGRGSGLRLPMLHDRRDLEIVLDPDPPKSAAGTNPRP